MGDAARANQSILHDSRGSAYLLAMITLLVGFVLGLALLRLVGSAAIPSTSSVEAGKAAYLAEAGINYGYWRYRYCGVTLPYSTTYQLGSDSFIVTVSQYPSLTDTVKIDSTGHHGGMSHQKSRVVRKRIRPFEMALCVGSSFNVPHHGLNTGNSNENGDAYINGNLSINAGSGVEIDGDLHVAGAVYNSTYLNVHGNLTTNDARVYFPPVDIAYYYSKANRVYSWGTKLSSLQFTVPYEVIYAQGKLTLEGPVSGTGLVVVNGDLEIPHDLTYCTPGSDKLAVLVTGCLILKAGTAFVHGFFYVHNPYGTAYFQSDSDTTFGRGGIAVDTIGSVEGLELIADPAYRQTDLPYRLHLPGYEPGGISEDLVE